MNFITEAHSDVGIKKKINQDALLVKQAKVKSVGHICMACLCDGMGGLSFGEVASAAFVERMDRWFKEELPEILLKENVTSQLDTSTSNTADHWVQIQLQWNEIACSMNKKIAEYGADKNASLGTTAVVMLVIENQALIMNVGDSRVYKITDGQLEQITHDQSFIQREIDAGRMTPEEALVSDQKSVLLQCIGASPTVVPDFFRETLETKEKFLLCSDGLWRKLENKEIVTKLDDKNGLVELIDLVKQRGETDNVSGLVVSVK